jgi:arylsulfatase A-like enzyme
MDIFPTVCAAAGVTPPADIDGVSFLPALHGGREDPNPRQCYFVRREGGPHYAGKSIEALRIGKWKLLQDSPFAPPELYNLQSDPLEAINLATKEHALASELSLALQKQIQRAGRVPWQPPAQ